MQLTPTDVIIEVIQQAAPGKDINLSTSIPELDLYDFGQIEIVIDLERNLGINVDDHFLLDNMGKMTVGLLVDHIKDMECTIPEKVVTRWSRD